MKIARYQEPTISSYHPTIRPFVQNFVYYSLQRSILVTMSFDFNLNNVEWATLFWYVVILVIVLYLDRRGAVNIVKLFFNSRSLVILLGLLILWCVIEILVLLYFNVEIKSQLKNILVWFFTVALVLPYKLITKKNDENLKPGKVIWDNFKFSAFLEILSTTYTLSIFLQILYTGIITFFSVLAAFSIKKDQGIVKSFFEKVLFALTLPYIVYVFVEFWENPDQIFQASTLVDYFIPILLSSLYIPFAWGVATWVSFDDVLSKTYRRIQDKSIRNYARRRSFFDLILYPDVARRWKHEVKRTFITSKEDVERSLERALISYKLERFPPVVMPSEGWSPYLAKNFMAEMALKTGYYDEYQDNVWNSFSNYIDLSDGILCNKINFFVEGNEHVAKSLNLRMCIYEFDYSEIALSRFVEMCRHLCRQAIDASLTYEIEMKLNQLESSKIRLREKEINLEVQTYSLNIPLIQITFQIVA